MAVVLLLTMRGTPFIYYGEEIGMRDVEIPADRKRDPVGRDGCRTPMQWSSARNGGFTTAPTRGCHRRLQGYQCREPVGDYTRCCRFIGA